MPQVKDDRTQTPYDILGVSPLDDFATIRAAWRRLVRTWHPDVWFGTQAEATRRMMAVNDAYDTISRLHKKVQEELAAEQTRTRQQDLGQAGPRRPNRQTMRPEPTAPPTPQMQMPVPCRPGRQNPAARRFDDARAMFARPEPSRVRALA